jgi:hypothetical protein
MIPIDFGEEDETKGAVVVEAKPGRAARVEFVALAAGRTLTTIPGALADLAQLMAACPNAILRVRVSDTDRIEHLTDDSHRPAEIREADAHHDHTKHWHTVEEPQLPRLPNPPDPGGRGFISTPQYRRSRPVDGSMIFRPAVQQTIEERPVGHFVTN